MKLQDSLKIALVGLLDEISSIPDIHESVFPALSVSVEEILVISKIGLVRREDRDVPGVEVMIVSRCGVTIKACFLGGLYPSLFAKRLCT